MYRGGTVAELRDGEGKGIAAIVAAYLAVLNGRRVHVVTLDAHLARRDFFRGRAALACLGISVGLLDGVGDESNGAAGGPGAQVVYGPFFEFVSRYLEENIAAVAGQGIQDGQVLAIADEADTILVDEARCLVQIIAAGDAMQGQPRRIIRHGVPDCAESDDPAPDGRLLAECRVRDYFRGYERIAGLTATAAPAAARFSYFYGLDLVKVAASSPDTRKDSDDLYYVGAARMLADLEVRVSSLHDRGRPVVLYSVRADMGQALSRRLAGRRIEHAVLGPSDDPAQIMAGIGQRGAVTILVGGAGRGYAVSLGDRAVAAAGGLFVFGVLQSGSARADTWARELAGRCGEPGESQFLHSSEEYSIVSKGGRLSSMESRRNGAPIRLDKSLRGRFFRIAVDDMYRRSEEYSFSVQRAMARYEDLAAQYRKSAYTLRKAILVGVGADELSRWTEDLEDSDSAIMKDVRAAYVRKVQEIGPDAMRNIARGKGVDAFDSVWTEYLAAQGDLLGGVSTDLSQIDKDFSDVRNRVQGKFDEAMRRVKQEVIAALINLLTQICALLSRICSAIYPAHPV